jgi:hypothetical protein
LLYIPIMPDEALRRLLLPENENLNWLLGDLLRARAAEPHWYRCVPLQQLERNLDAQNSWNALIRTCRASLAAEGEAQQRARELLNPRIPEFDAKLDDFVAELIAIWQLGREGAGEFHFLDTTEQKSPDLRAERGGQQLYVEVKNLREPDSIELAAFRRWHANQTRDPESFRFDVEIDYGAEPGNLTAPQREALDAAVDGLSARPRPSSFIVTLPGGLPVTFNTTDGPGIMSSGGPGVLLDDKYYADNAQRLILKSIEQIRKALSQLYNSSIPDEAIKVLFLRWKVPWDLAVGPSPIRDTVREGLQDFLGQFFPRLELRIVHNYDE